MDQLRGLEKDISGLKKRAALSEVLEELPVSLKDDSDNSALMSCYKWQKASVTSSS